jgi:hypothetical protein
MGRGSVRSAVKGAQNNISRHKTAREPTERPLAGSQRRVSVTLRPCCVCMDSLFEAFESVSETVSATLPDWLGDDPEEQEAHVHTRQARWEVLAAEAAGLGEGLDDGAGYTFRRPAHDDDDNDDTPLSPDALGDSHTVYGVSSLPPRPLPVDAEERAARLKAAAAAAQSARGSASPVAGSSSTPTGSSWASRPPPGSPAARIECVSCLL